MIGLVAALILQDPQVSIDRLKPVPELPAQAADLPTHVEANLRTCLMWQGFLRMSSVRTRSPVSMNGRTDDGSEVHTELGPRQCYIQSPRWSPRGEQMAQTVAHALSGWSFERVQWRELVVTEFGPTVWTTFEERNAVGRTTAIVRLIEPADGARGEVTISYQTIAP